MKNDIILALSLSLLFTGVTVYAGRGDFLWVTGLHFTFYLILLPTLPALGIAFWVDRRPIQQRPWMRRGLLAWCMAGTTVLIAIPLSEAIEAKDVREAKEFCEKLAAEADARYIADHQFPSTLESFRAMAQPPELARRGLMSYATDRTNTYSLMILPPSGGFTALRYTRESRTWKTID